MIPGIFGISKHRLETNKSVPTGWTIPISQPCIIWLTGYWRWPHMRKLFVWIPTLGPLWRKIIKMPVPTFYMSTGPIHLSGNVLVMRNSCICKAQVVILAFFRKAIWHWFRGWLVVADSLPSCFLQVHLPLVNIARLFLNAKCRSHLNVKCV